MIEPSKEAAQRQRRANWVGLRTLRQRPALVGATDDGEPIYEIRAVRLVLLGPSPHFNRLAPCSRCGRELPGAPVITAFDLDAELRPMICADCIRGTGITSVWDPEAARQAARGQEADAEGGTELPPPSAPPSPPAPPLSPAQAPPAHAPLTPLADTAPAAKAGVEAGPDANVAVGDRLAAMERHLGAVTARVNELGRRGAAHQAQSEERRRREADAAAARDAAVDRTLAELRADLATSLAANRPADGPALAAEVRAELVSSLAEDQAAEARALEDRLNERLALIRAELASSWAEDRAGDIRGLEDRLTARLEEIRHALAVAVAEDRAADVRALEDRLNDRLGLIRADLASSVADDEATAVHVFEDRLNEGLAGLAELVTAQRAEVATVVATLAEIGSEVQRLSQTAEKLARAQGALERRVAEIPAPVVDVEHMLEELVTRQRTGLQAAVEASVVARTAGLVRANDELVGEQTIFDRRLEALAGQLERVVYRLEELAAWTNPVGERIETLEKAMQQALRSRPVRHAASSRNGGAEATSRPPAPAAAPPSGSLLEGLERQLEAAAGRLAARSDAEPDR